MFFILSISVIIIVYISNFKSDFTKENIDKVLPVFAFLGIITAGLIILSCIF